MRRAGFALVLVAAAAVASTASASQVIGASGAGGLALGVNSKGEAMVSYTDGGKSVHVLAWGAENAVAPTRGGHQSAFELAYDGGYARNYTKNPAVHGASAAQRAKLRAAAKEYYRTFSCPTYDGPRLANVVAACKAPDGSYWAIQAWPRQLPDYGVPATGAQAAAEAHLAHWTGPLPVLTVGTSRDSRHHEVERLWGTFSYAGQAVYGYAATSAGVPLDSFGRNVYVDTYSSAYGAGWRRENSLLTHGGTGAFCYALQRHGSRPAGTGTSYRLSIIGPGVTPDVSVTVPAPAPYSVKAAAQARAAIVALHDSQCSP